jgi:hypothetical protein
MGVSAAQAQKPERPREARAPVAGVPPGKGWQLLSRDGCRFAVPVSWRAIADGMVSAPDGASSLSVRTVRIPSWPMHKAQIKAAFVHLNVVHEDSDHRLWFEFGDGKRITHYIATRGGPGACVALMDVDATAPTTAEETTKRIVDSIGPASN